MAPLRLEPAPFQARNFGLHQQQPVRNVAGRAGSPVLELRHVATEALPRLVTRRIPPQPVGESSVVREAGRFAHEQPRASPCRRRPVDRVLRVRAAWQGTIELVGLIQVGDLLRSTVRHASREAVGTMTIIRP